MKIGEKLDVLANISIILIAVLVISAVYRENRLGSSRAPAMPEIQVGATIPIGRVTGSADSKTLILVLNTRCRFCSESAPFYRTLVKQVGNNSGVRVIGVFPQSVSESRAYLTTLHVKLDDLRQEDLNSIPVAGTPTLLLVDHEGKVSSVWRGKLNYQQQAAVFRALGIEKPNITPEEVKDEKAF